MSQEEKPTTERRDLSPASSQTLQNRDDASRNWFQQICHTMGDLPQYKVRGKLLSGAALNWAIALVAGSGYDGRL